MQTSREDYILTTMSQSIKLVYKLHEQMMSDHADASFHKLAVKDVDDVLLFANRSSQVQAYDKADFQAFKAK